jgi:glycosyltransferase involved in cell wall biosynthesis
MANQLTVIIPCRNEERNIRACVGSVREIADEIIVADSGSTDNTLEMVRQMGGCRIIQREFIDYASFKNWAIPQATQPWVFILDADERVTEELAAEIRGLLAGTPACDGYAMRRQNYFLRYPIQHCGWNSPTVIRLFRRDVCRYGNRRVHEKLEVATRRVGKLRGKCLHYTCRSLTQFVQKQLHYASWSAEDMHASGRRVSYLGLLLRPPLRFLQLYLFRGGFLDGAAGLTVCMTTAFYTFLKYARLWELGSASRGRKPSRNGRPPTAQTRRRRLPED